MITLLLRLCAIGVGMSSVLAARVGCLKDPHLGLYVPPMIWSLQFGHTPHAVLLVMASGECDPADYINDYATYIAVARAWPRDLPFALQDAPDRGAR
jgi:hypothetical protein